MTSVKYWTMGREQLHNDLGNYEYTGFGASSLALPGKTLAVQPDDLCSFPGTHIKVERERQIHKGVLHLFQNL